MLVSWNLLKDFITLSASPEEAAERLTMAGAEVEGIEYTARALKRYFQKLRHSMAHKRTKFFT